MSPVVVEWKASYRSAQITYGEIVSFPKSLGRHVPILFLLCSTCLGCFGSSSVLGQFLVDGGNASWFESWAFGGQRESVVRKKLVTQFEAEIAHVDRACRLSPEQKEKLRLAAQGDVSRFFRLVEKARQQTAGMKPDQNQVQQIGQILRPIQDKIGMGLNTDDSLFQQVLNQLLDQEQQGRLENLRLERDRERRSLYIKLRIAKLERPVPMLTKQREALIELIESTIQDKKIPTPFEQSIADIAILSLSREKLGEILDREQVEALRKSVQNADPLRTQLEQTGIKLE